MVESIDLFGELHEQEPQKVSKYDHFRRHYNYRPGTKEQRCGNCIFHRIKHFSKRYHKCKHQGMNANPASDIRVKKVCDLWQIEND